MNIIDRHFAAEHAHDVAATLETYTDDIEWDDVTHPACPGFGKDAAAEMYGGILEAIPDLHLEPVRRFGSGDHVVDESVLSGHVLGFWAGRSGGGAPVRVRMLHVFDVRDGLIARENTWFDAANVIRQIEAFEDEQGSARSGGAPTG